MTGSAPQYSGSASRVSAKNSAGKEDLWFASDLHEPLEGGEATELAEIQWLTK